MSTEDDHFRDAETGPEWITPRDYWEPLADALGGFDLDPATRAEYPRIADDIYTPADDGLDQDWYGDVWVNPPYGRQFNEPWARKIAAEADRDAVETITALVPLSAGTMWWHRHYRGADYYTLVGDGQESPRITFGTPDRVDGSENNATFASLILSYGEFPPAYGAALRELGFVLEPAFPFRGGEDR